VTEPSSTHQQAPAKGVTLAPSPMANGHDRESPHPLAELHRAFGNLGALGRLTSHPIQPKLEIGGPDDAHEREADAVAASVMRQPEGADAQLSSSPSRLQRAPEDDKRHDQPAVTSPRGAAAKAAPSPAPAGRSASAAAAGKSTPPPTPGKAKAPPAQPAASTHHAGTKKSPEHPAAKGSGGGAKTSAGKAGKGTSAPRSPLAAKAPAKADPKAKAAYEAKAKQPGGHPHVHRDKSGRPAQAHRPKPTTTTPNTGATAREHPPGQASPAAHHSGGPPQLLHTPTGQAPSGDRKPDDPLVAAKPATPGVAPQLTPSAARTIRSAQGAGQPLAAGERSFFESRLGRDLGAVRVHDDAAAHAAARDIRARAFAYGQDVFFASGRRQTGTGAGRELMAHELAHTVQQRPGAKLERKLQRQPDPQPQTGAALAGVKRDPGTWTLTFPELEVPGFRLAQGGYSGALTRPKGYDRKQSAPKPQRDVWIEDVEGEVAKQVPRMLTGIGATLHEGRYFVHQLATGMPERFYISDVAGLAGDLTTPEWDAAGQGHGFRGFEVDHVLELQLGGTNTPENLELLDRRINGASGLFIMKSIEGKVQDYLAAVPDSDRNDPALKLADWRANWNLTFEKAVAPKKDPPPEPGGNDRWTREQIKQGKHLDQKGVLAEADPDKLGSKSEVKLFPSATGGVVTTLRPSEGADGVRFFKPFKATAAEYFVEDTSGPQLATFSFALDGTKGLKLDETPTVDAKRLPGMKFAGSVDRTAARRSLAKLGAVKLSPVELDTVDLGPNGIYAEGRIVTSLPIVAGTAIDLVLDGPELTVSHTFQMGDFKLPPPLKVTQSNLAVSASTDGDITITGRVDAQIDRLGKGFLAVDPGAAGGLSLSGGFDFTSEIFQQAHVGLSYHDGKYSGDGTLAIAGGKVAGIKSGSLHASYLEDHFEASGQAVFDLPGIDSAEVQLAYDEASGMTLTATPQLKQMAGIKSGSLTVTVQQPPGGGAVKLSGHGTAEPDIAGIDAQLTVDYDDGVFLAQVQAPFKAGLIDGTLTAGATNQPLGADGLPAPAPGGAGGELRMFGAGSATVKLTDSLTGTATIRLLANGEVEASGQLTVQSNLWEGRHLVNRDLVPRVAADVPIFPPVVLHLGAGLKLRVGYGPGVLSGSVGITYNPSHEDQAKLEGALHLHASAYAGLELYTDIGLGLGVTGASITGNIELGGELHLQANLDVEPHVSWTPAAGLVIDNNLETTLEPALVFDLDASVVATLGPLSAELWHEHLGSASWNLGLNFGLTWPIHYESHKPFEPSVADIDVKRPDLAPADVARQILQQKGRA
jgi:hypothetical protein